MLLEGVVGSDLVKITGKRSASPSERRGVSSVVSRAPRDALVGTLFELKP